PAATSRFSSSASFGCFAGGWSRFPAAARPLSAIPLRTTNRQTHTTRSTGIIPSPFHCPNVESHSTVRLAEGCCQSRLGQRPVAFRPTHASPASVGLAIRRRACFRPSNHASSPRAAFPADRSVRVRSSRAGASVVARGAAAPPSASPGLVRDLRRSRPYLGYLQLHV